MRIRPRHLLPFCLAFAQSIAWGQALPEPAVKSAYVYNFALFAEWPDENAGGALSVCVPAASPMAPVLADLNGKPVRQRRVLVRALAVGEAPRGCHMLYVDGADRERWRQLRGDAAGVLTVADSTDVALDGAMVSLVRDGNKLAFDIDAGAARAARIAMSSKLLRLARRLQP